jgi:hypothetical protein
MKVHANIAALIVIDRTSKYSIFTPGMHCVGALNIVFGLYERAEWNETVLVVVEIPLFHYHSWTVEIRYTTLYGEEVELVCRIEDHIFD